MSEIFGKKILQLTKKSLLIGFPFQVIVKEFMILKVWEQLN